MPALRQYRIGEYFYCFTDGNELWCRPVHLSARESARNINKYWRGGSGNSVFGAKRKGHKNSKCHNENTTEKSEGAEKKVQNKDSRRGETSRNQPSRANRRTVNWKEFQICRREIFKLSLEFKQTASYIYWIPNAVRVGADTGERAEGKYRDLWSHNNELGSVRFEQINGSRCNEIHRPDAEYLQQ